MEEYYDYDFPDDEKKVMGFKILENAMKWKQAAAAALKGTYVHTLLFVIPFYIAYTAIILFIVYICIYFLLVFVFVYCLY